MSKTISEHSGSGVFRPNYVHVETEGEQVLFLSAATGFSQIGETYRVVRVRTPRMFKQSKQDTTISLTNEQLLYWQEKKPEMMDKVVQLMNNANAEAREIFAGVEQKVYEIMDKLILDLENLQDADEEYKIRQTSKKYGI